MKWSIDGDQICITRDDFVNLQESPAVFVHKDSDAGKAILEGGLKALPIGDLVSITNSLRSQMPAMEYIMKELKWRGRDREAEMQTLLKLNPTKVLDEIDADLTAPDPHPED